MQKYLIACLGNIGAEYEYTRHNIGFFIGNQLVNRLNSSFSAANFGQVCEASYKGRKMFILKPDTYMNLSGNAVKFWLKKENIPIENLMVVADDLSLPLGTLRIKTKGSNAGHNGLKSIEAVLETQKYSRFRFGIGDDFMKGQQVDYVLGRWTEEEINLLPERIDKSVDAILSFVFAGITNTMNTFNGK